MGAGPGVLTIIFPTVIYNYMVICVDNSHLGALQKTPDPSWLALTVPGALMHRKLLHTV